MIETSKRVEFLKKVHLFNGLSDEQLTEIAETLKETNIPPNGTIFEQNQPADRFILIYSGRVRLSRLGTELEHQPVILVRGDYFGEEALQLGTRRTVQASALHSVILLYISRQDLEALLDRNYILKKNMEISVYHRRLAQQIPFKWVHGDEVVYFLSRKHPILLLRGLIGPVVLLIIPLLLFTSTLATKAGLPTVMGVISLLVLVLWAIWNVIDWGNDYYIITSQRVVWLEKVIGIYDSRQEAPLTMILAVDADISLFGRTLDYGDVNVRTYVGQIMLRFIHHPYQAANILEELWQRSKEVSMQAEREAMQQVIRERFGLSSQEKPVQQPSQSESAIQKPKRAGFLQAFSTGMIKMRYEDGDTITYHKHWFVLFKQTGLPAFLSLATIGLIIARLVYLWQNVGPALIKTMDNVILFELIVLVPFTLWWLYQFIDWSNDKFQVTPEEIVDTDRKPLGTEERRAAPLENIISTEYARRGLIGNIFNYGTVYITIGATQMEFEDVYDPAGVQQDIDSHRLARLAKKKDAEIIAERERMAEWLATYHISANELRDPGYRGESGDLSNTEQEPE